jgi:hypothetical protein
MADRHEKARDLTEAGLTNAILRLRRTHRVRVGFLNGHDERDPRGRQKDGIMLAVDALRGANYDLSDFNLLTTPNALDSLDLVVCVGPISEPLPGELVALDAFLDRGGRFLALLDPNLPTRAERGSRIPAPLGIRVGATRSSIELRLAGRQMPARWCRRWRRADRSASGPRRSTRESGRGAARLAPAPARGWCCFVPPGSGHVGPSSAWSASGSIRARHDRADTAGGGRAVGDAAPARGVRRLDSSRTPTGGC